MAEPAQDPRRTAARPGILSRTFGTGTRLVMWILLSLVFSVIIEWVGMTLWWPQQGTDHSREMLVRELGYLDREFRRSVVTSDPIRFAEQIADRTHYLLFEATGFEYFIRWVSQPPSPSEQGIRPFLHQAYRHIAEYIVAATQVTQVFSVRLAVLTLAMPVFLLFGLIALVDGLVRRDLRRWGGGAGEFVRLPLREEGRAAVAGADLGRVSGAAVQLASYVGGAAVRGIVWVERDGDREYV